MIFDLAAMGTDKSDAVRIGDSFYDVVGAEQAGIDFIAVTYGFGFKSEEDAKKYDCAAVCESVSALVKYLI